MGSLINDAAIIVRFERIESFSALCSHCCETVVPVRYFIPIRERPAWPVKTKVAELLKSQLPKAQKKSVKLKKTKKLTRHN